MTLNSINQYGHDFQIKVLSSLLTHKEFLVNIHDIISEEYFENQAQKWAIKEVLNSTSFITFLFLLFICWK